MAGITEAAYKGGNGFATGTGIGAWVEIHTGDAAGMNARNHFGVPVFGDANGKVAGRHGR